VGHLLLGQFGQGGLYGLEAELERVLVVLHDLEVEGKQLLDVLRVREGNSQTVQVLDIDYRVRYPVLLRVLLLAPAVLDVGFFVKLEGHVGAEGAGLHSNPLVEPFLKQRPRHLQGLLEPSHASIFKQLQLLSGQQSALSQSVQFAALGAYKCLEVSPAARHRQHYAADDRFEWLVRLREGQTLLVAVEERGPPRLYRSLHRPAFAHHAAALPAADVMN
jgi:hypothetical protein